MLSKYFQYKIKTKQFEENLKSVLNEIKDKKIIIYGAGEGFFHLNKIYNFTKNLNIVAIADKKYEDMQSKPLIEGIQAIEPAEIMQKEYDYILISNEYPRPVYNFLAKNLWIDEEKIKTMFEEEIKDERNNLYHLYDNKFDKTYPELIKKLNGKNVVLYGAGLYLEIIEKIFGLSELNIIGIADKKYENPEQDSEFLGYKTYTPDKIEELNPDYVLVCTKFYVNVIQDLYDNLLSNTKIKIKPIVKKSFWSIMKEIWR